MITAQGLNPATLLKQPTNSWPTFNGDYSGRRYSPLKQINEKNVHELALAWSTRVSQDAPGRVVIKSTPLLINDILYFTSPNNIWAAERTQRARTLAL